MVYGNTCKRCGMSDDLLVHGVCSVCVKKALNLHDELVEMLKRYDAAIVERKLDATQRDAPLAVTFCEARERLKRCEEAGE